MGFAAEQALVEHHLTRHRRNARPAMINLEINDLCRFSAACSSNCILNQLGSGLKPEMPADRRLALYHEICESGETVDVLAVVGKEPCETPDRLEALLELYYRTSPDVRPRRIGMITAGYALPAVRDLLVKHPLDWVIVSADTPETGLRSPDQPMRAIAAAVDIKRSGGCRELGCNSVIYPGNLANLIRIGETVFSEPEIDQWSVSPMRQVVDGRVEPILSYPELKETIARLVHHFAGERKTLLVTLAYEELVALAGGVSRIGDPHDSWRVEHAVPGSNVILCALNEKPGYFLRMRYDSEILSHSEFHGSERGRRRFDRYTAGALQSALGAMTTDREQLTHIVGS